MHNSYTQNCQSMAVHALKAQSMNQQTQLTFDVNNSYNPNKGKSNHCTHY